MRAQKNNARPTHVFLLGSDGVLLLVLPKERPESPEGVALGRGAERRHGRLDGSVARLVGDGAAVARQGKVAGAGEDGGVVVGPAGGAAEEAGEEGEGTLLLVVAPLLRGRGVGSILRVIRARGE